jgi:hypothetical protein
MEAAKRQAELLREAEAKAIHEFAEWAKDVSAQLTAARTLLCGLGVTEQAWHQAVDEAKRSLPQDPQPSHQAFAEFLRKLSEK